MARAAAKRKQGAKQVARPAPAERARVRHKREKSLEDQLFFSRIRGHAKWAFVFLAVVFGASFVFLGVGSGNAGLGDVFSNVFGGSSGPSIDSLREKVAESPKDRTAAIDLAQALERDGQTEEAILVYRGYLRSRPKDVDMLNNLALLYQSRAGAAAAEANAALTALSQATPGTQFGLAATGKLGQALSSFRNPFEATLGEEAQQRYGAAVRRYQSANREALGIYKRLTNLQPGEPTVLISYARAAAGAGELRTAIAAYEKFVREFPEDQFVVDARRSIKQLEAELRSQQQPSSSG